MVHTGPEARQTGCKSQLSLPWLGTLHLFPTSEMKHRKKPVFLNEETYIHSTAMHSHVAITELTFEQKGKANAVSRSALSA